MKERSTLEDLDFADDIALPSHTHKDIQEKTCHPSHYSQIVENQSEENRNNSSEHGQ
uniref:Uncharacterized protein n=1 Tax=Arion vulgaris TaxID=1028688 RepID=A0A0B7B4R2_9EUPU